MALFHCLQTRDAARIRKYQTFWMTIDCEATPNRPRQAETKMYTGSTVTSRNSLGAAAAAKGISLLLRLESLTEVLFNNLNDFPARLNLGFYGFSPSSLSAKNYLWTGAWKSLSLNKGALKERLKIRARIRKIKPNYCKDFISQKKVKNEIGSAKDHNAVKKRRRNNGRAHVGICFFLAQLEGEKKRAE